MSVTLDATQFGTLDAHYPVLLLPVSVQVKYVATPTLATPYELRVRIYPDQLGISTHEAPLTAAEVAAGQAYWQQAPLATPGQLHSLDYWRPLVARYGAPRAQWLLRQTTPTNLSAVRGGAAPAFAPAGALATERWTQAAQARALPECFSVLLYTQATGPADLPASLAGDQLFPGGTAPAYAPALVPEPTTEFLNLYKVVTGSTVTKDALAVGLAPPTDDPAAPQPAPEPTALPIGGIDADNRWTVDFERAVAVGMALRVPLTQAEYAGGFARLVVLGVRAATAQAGQQAVHDLLSEHYYTTGLGLVPQGTPTNNTEAGAAGFSSRERADADASFALLTQPEPATLQPWATRPDGQHLATALGLADALPPLAGAPGQDAQLAQVVNRALWPATYGYFLEEMLHGLLTPEALTWTRAFFENYVLARGAVPALRVGAQPYGVLPTTRFSAWEVPDAANNPYPEHLRQTLAQLDVTWTERLNPQPHLYGATLTGAVAATAQATTLGVAPPAPDNLLTALALDATSTEYYQRYLIGPALADALNQAAGQAGPSDQAMWADTGRRFTAFDATANPFYQEFRQRLDPSGTLLPAEALPIFGRVFQSTYTKLADAFADEPAATRHEGLLLDGQPLSETQCLAPFGGVGASGPNFAQWLATASFEDIRVEDFTLVAGPDFVAPTSLLYRLLRQAVLREYWAAARAYRASAANGTATTPALPAVPAGQALDQELFNIDATDQARWSWLYDQVTPAATGQAVPLHHYLQTQVLGGYLAAVGQLGSVPTAQLERLLAEHLDLGSYRLDAWRLAQVAERLDGLRATQPTGSHLGAFGWLERLHPADASTPDAATGLRHDPDNLGYLHAPSLTHGTAAAILRQGYKSRQHTADGTDPAADRMAVDVSSRRVRAALALLDGLRAGHSLGTLLGQSLERALQQYPTPTGGTPFARYIEKFRQRYPLAAEHALAPGPYQPVPTGLAPEQAARQVLDGAALLRGAGAGYPFGVAGLPTTATNPAFVAFATAQVAQLVDDLDALGDLAVSEGIYQAARGNADRAGAVLESVAKGQYPTNPDVVHPAQRSFTLTQRVLVHLPTDTLALAWPAAHTPRQQAAPRLNAWLTQFFPDPTTLSFGFDYQDSKATTPPYSLLLADVGLHAIDLLYLLEESALQAGSAFDRQLVLAAEGQVPAGAPLVVRYLDDATGTYGAPAALRRLLPLLARLRQLVGGARPARPHDLQAPALRTADPYQGAALPTFGSAKTALQGLVAALAPGQPAATQRTALGLAGRLGLAEATAALAEAAPAAGAATVRAAAQARLDAAEAVRTAYVAAHPTASLDGDAVLEVGAAYFGAGFRPDVEFTLGGDILAAYAAAADPAAAALLLRHYLGHPDPTQDQPLALQEWLHGLATVREPLNQLDKVFLINGLLNPEGQYASPAHPQGAALLPLQPAQYAASASAADYWLGLPWPEGYVPPADALSLVQWLPAGYDPAQPQAALWLDEWVETLPLASQATALTFHYDQPNSEAPQTMLLVVPPRADRSQPWRADDLLGAVNETLDLAKKRTVEPDGLARTHLATVLPAVVAPVAQQAVTFTLDLGSINQTARFGEAPLMAPS